MSYIEAEMQLEKLRKLRVAKIRRQNSKDRYKPSKSDMCIVQHIHLLFKRACSRWRGDVDLVLQHVQFARSARSFKQVSRIYAEALQVHPRNTSLWIEAASNEYFEMNSIQTARVLFQRALRINKTKGDLWLQYATLEWHYATKLRGRRSIVASDLANHEEEVDEYNIKGILDGNIPRFIYKNAIKAIPNDVQFRVQFLDLCSQFPGTDVAANEIIKSMDLDMSDVADAWIARAAFALSNGSTGETSVIHPPLNASQSRVIEVIDQGATKCSDKLDYCIKSANLLQQMIERCEEEKQKEAMRTRIDKILFDCSDDDDTKFCEKKVAYLMYSSQYEKAMEILSTVCNDSTKESSLWIQKAQCASSLGEDPVEILRHASNIVEQNSQSHLSVLLAILDAILSSQDTTLNFKRSKKAFHKVLLLLASSEDFQDQLNNICCDFLRFHIVASKGDIESIRRIYSFILKQVKGFSVKPGVVDCTDFFNMCLNIEKIIKQSKSSSSDGVSEYQSQLKKIRECALIFYKGDQKYMTTFFP